MFYADQPNYSRTLYNLASLCESQVGVVRRFSTHDVKLATLYQEGDTFFFTITQKNGSLPYKPVVLLSGAMGTGAQILNDKPRLSSSDYF